MNRRKMKNSRRCENGNVDVHGTSYVKHMRSKTHLENIRQDEIFIPDWLFKEEQPPIKKQTKKYITLKH